MALAIVNASFHKNINDNSCQIVYGTEGYEDDSVSRFHSIASGVAEFGLLDATGAITRRIRGEFAPVHSFYNQSYLEEGVNASLQIKPPMGLPGWSGFRMRLLDVTYNEVILVDVTNHYATWVPPYVAPPS